ncbi:active breakpoint cluster region-related protein [Nematolebias whitei]|uniref:active breakpoint cluster region-related protein n=1 Tax=Nematolebias whitei TaxID=451745 RepID=UPI00189BEAFF|nr:active breakpoint cluster region-related protein [Nematolebias whitei]
MTALGQSTSNFLQELSSLMSPMKALRASAGTSQPVLSSQEVQTVFYHVPELRDVHQNFCSGLKARLDAQSQTELVSSEETGTACRNSELEVGDMFLKMINHLSLYGGFIENYEKAVEVVRKCTQSDPRFRTLAESLMSNNTADKTRTKYTLEALLYKPLDRVTKTTLALQDLLKTTPVEHKDYAVLQEVLRLSRSFLSGINESSQSKRGVTLSHGMRRQLIRDGFVVDVSESVRSLRHLFLYTDLLLCTRFKHAARGKQDQYRFSWYLPLAGLKLHWAADEERSPEVNIRLHTLRTKLYLLRQQLQQNTKGTKIMALAARNKKKLEQMELMLLTYSPVYRLELHSPSGKELSFEVDGAKSMKVLCVAQSDGQEDSVLGKTSVELEPQTLSHQWRRQTLQLGQVDVTLSLKYTSHPLEAPSLTVQQPVVFGVSIETVAQQEGVLVPHVVRCCVEEVERRGLDEVGIYRISGTTTDINMLKSAFNSNLREAVTRLRSAEVNAVAGLLKLYIRDLPESLIPAEMFQSLAKTLGIQDLNSRLASMLSLLDSCPDVNRHTFLFLLHHLQRVAQRQDINKMSLLNLATVFGPSLLRPPVAGLGHNGPTVDISQEVVIQAQVIFSYLQCNNLPGARTSIPYDSDPDDETTYM